MKLLVYFSINGWPLFQLIYTDMSHMNSQLINNLIDYRSEKLWQEINAYFKVSIEQTKEGNYGCFTQDD